MMKTTKFRLFLLVCCLFFPAAVAASGVDSPLLIEVGSLASNIDTDIQVASAGGNRGTSVDLEDDLGFVNDEQINRIELRYRITTRHSLKYSFFQLDRSARYNIDRTIVIGDTEFPINADIRAGFDYTLHAVSYGYSLKSDADSNLDVLGGFYYIGLDLSVEQDGGPEEFVSGNGPLPFVGFNYERSFSDKWGLGLRGTIFKLTVGDVGGTLADARIRVDYGFTDKFALGLAYNWQNMNVDVDDSLLTGDFDMITHGPEIAAVFRF